MNAGFSCGKPTKELWVEFANGLPAVINTRWDRMFLLL